eukprot:scaffold59613_cov59-Attheya_sp.AAC.1
MNDISSERIRGPQQSKNESVQFSSVPAVTLSRAYSLTHWRESNRAAGCRAVSLPPNGSKTQWSTLGCMDRDDVIASSCPSRHRLDDEDDAMMIAFACYTF